MDAIPLRRTRPRNRRRPGVAPIRVRPGRIAALRARIAAATSPRFASIAIAVWNGLPLRARLRLLRHWLARVEAPAIVFADRVLSDDGQGCYATCGCEGTVFEFDRRDVTLLPVRGIAAVLVHELVHGYQVANGKPMDEDEARRLAARWGHPWREEYDRLALTWQE